MPERRNKTLIVNLEETFDDLFSKAALHEGLTRSAMGRQLVLDYLVETGVIADADYEKVLRG